MSPPSLRRYRAERLLAKEFTGLRSKVLSIVRFKLRGHSVRLAVVDLEGCYAQAWQGLYAAVLEGEQVEDAAAWLVVATFRRALDESDTRARRATKDGESETIGFDPDIDAVLDARARLVHLFEGLRAGLSTRECEVASLCYLQGLTRSEAAARMGISEARMRKLMDGASPTRPGVATKVGKLLSTIEAGEWCQQQSSLMRAFAFGILDPQGDRYGLAVSHCRECPACRAHVASLRGLAAVLPPLWIPLAGLGAGGAGLGIGGVGASASSSLARGQGALIGGGARIGVRWWGGSFAVKLAAGGLILLGGGYAAVDGLIHGGPPNRRVPVSEVSAANTQLGAVLPAGARHSSRRSRSSRHSAQSATAASGSRAPGRAAPEFGPERISLATAPSSLSERRHARASREFGFE